MQPNLKLGYTSLNEFAKDFVLLSIRKMQGSR